MEDHLRIAVCLWHSFNWPGSDVFGAGTFDRPWLAATAPTRWRPRATKLDAAFEFIDEARRAVLHASTTATSRRRAATLRRDARQPRRDRRRHRGPHGAHRRRSCCGAPPTCSATRATPPAPRRTRIPRCSPTRRRRSKLMLEATHRLGGANYVLWGGREGYETLLNTDLAREEAQLARFLTLVAEHKHRIGFDGHAADRAEAAGADEAPVRLRLGDRATRSSPATASRTSTGSTSRPTTPRSPATASTTRSPSPSPRASSAAST